MKPKMMTMTITISLALAVGIALGAIGHHFLHAQQPPIKRTEVLKTDMAGMEGKEANMWVAEIAPGAATGQHRHPTPRFVYVISGAVTFEAEGKPPQTFNAGQGYVELPEVAHNFRNASATDPAKALGFQIVGKGEPLQY